MFCRWFTVVAIVIGALLGCTGTGNGGSNTNWLECDTASDCPNGEACVARRCTDSPCATGPGVTVLYEGTVTALAVAGDRVVVLSDALFSVPLAGGSPTLLTRPNYAQGLFTIDATAYYQEWSPDGGIVPGSGGYPLMAVPTSGGRVTEFLSALPAEGTAGATDDTSYYFMPIRAVGDVGTISRLTPPSNTIVEVNAEPFSVYSIAPYGEDVYFIGDAVSDTSLSNAFVGRVAKQGGTVQHLVSDIGLATSLVADASGLYWIQPLGRWSDGVLRGNPYSIAHAHLDGTSRETLITEDVTSLAVARGRAYFTTSTEVDSIASSGGAVTTITRDQNNPTMLTIAGGNLVWYRGVQNFGVDAGSAPSTGDSAAPPSSAIVTTCIPP